MLITCTIGEKSRIRVGVARSNGYNVLEYLFHRMIIVTDTDPKPQATALLTTPPLLKRFEDAYDSLSKQNKRVCSFFLRNHLKAAFLTAAQVAEYAGVSPATVVRFCTAMGFSGFSDLQQQFKTMAADGLGTEFLPVKPPATDPAASHSPLIDVASVSMRALKELIEDLDGAAFERASLLLFKAQKILVTGHKASLGIAAHAAYVLSKIHADVRHVQSVDGFDSFGALNDVNENDVLLAFTVIHYPTATLEIMRTLAQKGVRIVLVTDFKMFDEADLAQEVLLAPLRFHGFLDQMAPMLAIADALAFSVYQQDEEKGRKRLKEFNAFNEEIQAFAQVCRFSD